MKKLIAAALIIEIQRSDCYSPTPLELAQVFCGMDNTEQASFFNCVAEIVSKWEIPFCFQLQMVVDTGLTEEAKHLLEQFGEYAAIALVLPPPEVPFANEVCTYCGKTGHWRPDCPEIAALMKKKNKNIEANDRW